MGFMKVIIYFLGNIGAVPMEGEGVFHYFTGGPTHEIQPLPVSNGTRLD